MPTEVLIRNNVQVRGSGTQPMLLAHGFGCDQNMWRYITPAFEDDYRIVLFDYVGAGRSNRGAYDARRYSDLNGYAQDIIDICEALDLRDVVLVTHSVSGMIGLLAAIRQPERFDRLVLVSPSPRYLNETSYVGGLEPSDVDELLTMMQHNYLGWATTLAQVVMGNADRPALGEELRDSFCSTDPVIAHQFARVTFLSDNRADLPKLTVPALILQCTDDLIAPPVVGEYTHRHLPGSTLRYLNATGHCPHLSAPAEVIAVMKSYLHQPQVA